METIKRLIAKRRSDSAFMARVKAAISRESKTFERLGRQPMDNRFALADKLRDDRDYIAWRPDRVAVKISYLAGEWKVWADGKPVAVGGSDLNFEFEVPRDAWETR